MERLEITVQICNEDGFHARPAGIFAKAAAKFQSTIEVHSKGQSKNAKSIMGMMSLGLQKGDEIVISAVGTDAKPALDELSALVRAGISPS